MRVPILGLPTQVAPAKSPDRIGPYARAWLCTDPQQADLAPLSVCEWLIEAPTPEYRFFTLGVLRLTDGRDEYNRLKLSEFTTHEFKIMGLDPTSPLPDVDRWGVGVRLGEDGIRHQDTIPEGVRDSADARAARIAEGMVRLTVIGGFSPHHTRQITYIEDEARNYRKGRNADGTEPR